MIKTDDIFLVNKFPDFNIRGFDMDAYNEQFVRSNVIINAWSSDIYYAEHWGCLSIKCAFGGTEVYQVADRYYAVNDTNFFVCNDGEYYSSFINSDQQTESFTLNFSPGFVKMVAGSLLLPETATLDDPGLSTLQDNEFAQKLYPHNGELSAEIYRLKYLVNDFSANKEAINETYISILRNLFLSQQHVQQEIKQINACKLSTRKELYKRLHYAKDYIDSCFTQDISLEQLALIACLNSAYLLREFKAYFKLTPYQYLIKKRIDKAAQLLTTTRLSVAEICGHVGYVDVSSFCKLFKKYHQLSPDKYREHSK